VGLWTPRPRFEAGPGYHFYWCSIWTYFFRLGDISNQNLFKVAKIFGSMAAAFIHYFLGIGIASLFGYTGIEAAVFGLVGAVQDLDFLSFFFYKHLSKSRHAKLLMHRGITHTIVFALASSAVVLFVLGPVISFFVLINFLLHIFTDYVTAWGVAPLQPFSEKRYSLGLMTIFDVPLTFLSVLVGASGFFSVNPLWAFAAFFGYVGLRFVLKQRLAHQKLVPMGNFTYAFCCAEDDYNVGKVDILGREETIAVAKITEEIDPFLLNKIDSKIEESMFSHFLEYPTYSVEDGSIKVRDARSYLFPRSSRFGFTVFYDRESENLYVLVGGRKVELH